ncbi:MAG: hypothetical protein AUK48_03200 [Oscillatoriales cyanobacterium CG2_30_44_21]|nr:MAG: hypothetical protein AUK48_03200 [Oscillatoriales cyanobacterium CG2_30_44_21]
MTTPVENQDLSRIAPNIVAASDQPAIAPVKISCENNPAKGLKIPLSWLITLPFILNTFFIVGLIGWLSFRNGHEAITLLANKLYHKAAEQVQDRLNSYLELPYNLNRINASTFDLQQININDEKKVQTHFWRQLQEFPQISNIYLAATDGKYLGARRIGDKLAIEDNMAVYMADRFGQPQAPLRAKSFNLADHSWYQSLQQTKQNVWTEVYTDSIFQEPAITCIQPLLDKNGDIQGVLGVSLLLGDISRFLKDNKVSPNGQTLIVEPSGHLVATSHISINRFLQANYLKPVLEDNDQAQLTQNVTNWLNSRPLHSDDKVHQSIVHLNGEKYFLQVGKLKNDAKLVGLNWRVVVAVPESDFVSQIRESTISTAMLCLLALLLNAILGVIAARRISQPIAGLSQASQSIANGNLDQKVESYCVIKELAILANSFNQMSHQLKKAHDRQAEYSYLLVQKVDERTHALQQEILDHELTEEALRDSEEKFAKAFQSSPDGMALMSTETRKHIDINDKWTEITGYSREEAIGANPTDLKLWADLQDRDQMLAILETEGRVSNFEARFIAKNGKQITGLISSESIEFGGKPFAIYVIKDISDRKVIEENIKESEKKYRDLVESANCIILRWDTQGRIYFLNDYGLQFFGYTLEEIIGKYVLDTIVSVRNVTDEDLRHMISEICRAPEKYQLVENENLCKDGRHVWVTWSNKPIYNEQNQLIEILSVGTDISDRKRAEKELQSAKEIADMANRAKSEFLANMSHELRTPLNGILGYAQILKRNHHDASKRMEGLDIIQRSGEHLLTLLNDILDLSKIEAKKLELNPSEFDLPKLLHSVIEMFELQVRAKDVQICYQPLSDIPVTMYGDEKRLRQVLINLLGNAVKFTDRGHVTLSVSAQACEGSSFHNHRIRFAIADTGVGIAPPALADIFLPFQQVGDRARQMTGTGLGLPICQKIVEMMGGKLTVESAVSIGSTFSFEIELAEILHLTIPVAIDRRTIIGYEGDRRKILIVDDKTENRMVLNDLLHPLGFTIAEAINGHDCLEKAQIFRPDLILLDMVMPEIDGHETARRLRQISLFEKTAIIMVSASAFNQDRSLSIEAGCNDFITKPVAPEVLFQTMRSLLNLEWQYEEFDHSLNNAIAPFPTNSPLNQSIIFPPQPAIEKLRHLARIGDVIALQDEVILLRSADSSFEPFANQVLTYTRDFQLKHIRDFLEPRS